MSVPSACVIAKIVGVASTTGSIMGGNAPVGVWIRTTVEVRPAISKGTIALICVELTYRSGAGIASKVT